MFRPTAQSPQACPERAKRVERIPIFRSGGLYTSTLIVMEGYGDVLGGYDRMMDVERELGDLRGQERFDPERLVLAGARLK